MQGDRFSLRICVISLFYAAAICDRMHLQPLPKGSQLHMQKQQNLQDLVLNTARKERMTVTVFLMNGFQFKGTVRGFDSFVVIVETDGRQQMIYKHAISTVVPPRPLPLGDGE